MINTSLKTSGVYRSRTLVLRLLKLSPKIHYACLNTSSESKSSTVSASIPSNSPMIQLLEPLKNSKSTDKSLQKISNLSSKSFLDIQGLNIKLSTEDKAPRSYSTKRDGVVRQPFEKEINYMKSLMESFLADKYYERAFPLLVTFSGIVESNQFTKLANQYLEALVDDESISPKDLQENIDKLINQCEFVMNNRTRALRLTKYLQNNPDYNIEEFFKYTDIPDIKDTLANQDILGMDNLYRVFHYPQAKNWLPGDLQEQYRQYTINKKDQTVVQDTKKLQEKDGTISPLKKENLVELAAVDSFGLKVVRHSLLGLKPSEINTQQFASDLQDITELMTNTNNKELIKSGKLNYFEMYQLLETQEQRDLFNDAFERFNQDRQRQLEVRGVEGAKEKWRHEFEENLKRNTLISSRNLNAQLYDWCTKLVPLLEEEIQLCKDVLLDKVIDKERAAYAPFLIKLDPEKAAVITILELLKLQSTGGVINGMRTLTATLAVGKALELEYMTQQISKKYAKIQNSSNKEARMLLKYVRKKALENGANEDDLEWTVDTRIKIGAILISLLSDVAKVTVGKQTEDGYITAEQSAFFHKSQFVGGQRIGIIMVHNQLIQSINRASLDDCIQPQHLPMVIKPMDWQGFYGGGQMYSRTPLIRVKDAPETEAYVKSAAKKGALDEVFAGLNVLGNTAWTVNKDIYQVISYYWNTEETFLDIPGVMEKPIFPPKPERNEDPSIKYQYNRLVTQISSGFVNLRSQRCDANYKLEIARGFIGEKLYFPHNLDFRGRAYPISPHFNHLGGDLTRSLFMFWEGKELGENGLRWLKIQLANVYGFDKAPFEERVKFVEDNLQHAFESAKDPYAENAWWKKADKPWQALAVCFDLNRAYQLPDPTKYVSHMVVHQDGTCNGLQHYAALGGDFEGARQVNLASADRPQDVYAYVAGLVTKAIEEDAIQNNNKHALFLKDKITRKVVKPTVMTNVYGVTYLGALQQIIRQLDPLFDNVGELKEHASYLTGHVFKAIRQLFENAHLIQDWLGESARRISKSVSIDYTEKDTSSALHSSAVIWTSPLNLPCVQPYRKPNSDLISSAMQLLVINNYSGAGMVDSRKQQAGFPPNYIHSLDATHMMMTAAACGKLGLNFASVHDSFWTHACDVDTMNTQIREQFIKLHSSNLISILKEEFETRYKDNYQLLRVSRKHELVKEIQKLRQTWGKQLKRKVTIGDEIYMERRRLELLNSKDPKQVKIGEEMVTTISLVADRQDELQEIKTSNGIEILKPLKFPEVPPKGEFDVNLVKDSLYFFS